MFKRKQAEDTGNTNENAGKGDHGKADFEPATEAAKEEAVRRKDEQTAATIAATTAATIIT